MQRSTWLLITGLLALATFAPGTPALAHGAGLGRPQATTARHAGRAAGRRSRVHSLRGCRRHCTSDTGGTPAQAPRHSQLHGTPRTPHRVPAAAGQNAPKDPTPTPESTTAPGRAPVQDTAAVIAAVLSTPCPNTELTPSAENIALVRDAVLCLINRERAEHSLSPLTVNPRLESAAEGHCAELIADDYFAHVSPSGETPVDRIAKTGYIPGPNVGYVIGENLAWGTYSLSTPQSIVSAWIASPGHLANILESQYTETGIGIVPAVPSSLGGGAPGATYAQEFGVIIH